MALQTTIVFLDRSILESENFFSSIKIKQLALFAQKEIIHLKITEVTYNEIRKGLKDNLVKAKRALEKVRKDARTLKNLSKYDEFFETTVMDIDIDYNEILNVFDKFIEDNNIEIIGNGYINVESVLKDYFDGNKPFGEGRKKNEFPDAFILSTIEGYCTDKDIKVYVLSHDNDIKEYESPTGQVLIKENMGEFISEVHEYHNKAIFNFVDARSFQDNYQVGRIIDKDFYGSFEDEISKIIFDNPYYEEEEFEINDIEIKNMFEYNVLEIDGEDATVEYLFDIEISAKISYNDLSTGLYDSEDGQWVGVEHFIEEKTYNSEVHITVNHKFDLKTNLFTIEDVESFEIESFEEG